MRKLPPQLGIGLPAAAIAIAAMAVSPLWSWSWITGAALYALFLSHYQNWRGPLTQTEIDRFLQSTQHETSLEDFRAFLEADDGREVLSAVDQHKPNVVVMDIQMPKLGGLEFSGERISAIKCYLTGENLGGGAFSIRRLQIKDKHGLTRVAYNAKVNIYRETARPILLGIEDRKLPQARELV